MSDMPVQKRRFIAMVGFDVLCLLAAFTAIFAHVSLHQAWGLPVFILAMAAGFGAQIWFIVGLVRAPKPKES